MADSGELITPSDSRKLLCPHCGEPLVSSRTDGMQKPRLWLLAAVALMVMAALCFGLWLHKRKHAGASNITGSPGDFRATNGGPRAPQPNAVFSDHLVAKLAEAAVNGDVSDARNAIAQGAKVNSRGRDGLTPLHLALLHFQFAGFNALLENGADPNLAAENGDSIMSLTAVMPEPKWLEAALLHGGQVERRDSRERTPLMLAASRGRAGNVLLLLSKQAEVNTRDNHGDTALIHTFQAFAPNAEIARALLDHGGRADEADAAGFSARDYASTYGDPTFLTVFPERR